MDFIFESGMIPVVALPENFRRHLFLKKFLNELNICVFLSTISSLL